MRNYRKAKKEFRFHMANRSKSSGSYKNSVRMSFSGLLTSLNQQFPQLSTIASTWA